MKKTHIFSDKATGLFFAIDKESGEVKPTVDRYRADLFELSEVWHFASLYYKTNDRDQFDVLEASVGDWQRWFARKGGSVSSERKARAVRRNGAKGGRPKKETETK